MVLGAPENTSKFERVHAYVAPPWFVVWDESGYWLLHLWLYKLYIMVDPVPE